MKVLAKARIEKLLDRLASGAEVYVPMLRGPGTGFYTWTSYDEDYDELVLDRLNVYMPPKHIMITAAEKNHINLLQDSGEVNEKIIFGIRSCDVQGIVLLDEFCDAEGVSSTLFHSRRDRTIMIANACYHPAPSCFCDSVGIDPREPVGADVIIRDTGRDGYVWEARSPKGERLTQKVEDLLEEKQVTVPALQPFSLQVNWDGVTEKLGHMQDHPLWEKHSEACQTCALCTLTCPACNCMDWQADVWRETGYAFACRESCAYKNDTLMPESSGRRQAATERFRNRWLHKLHFYPQRYGKIQCTGCGRCIVLCPSGASISKMITEIQEADVSSG
ncbi:MAG TPA: 4Fe-4S dicluster domain-containing protein [Syntrophomonas sp.]|nr:4Fe-4S dicluster domain-containing protein [Syntrophomonas sp.]